MRLWSRSQYRTAPLLVVLLLVTVYVVVFGMMSLRRHQNLRTNALDLGYTDQAVWNTLHGRPFRFSTYLDAAFKLDIPIQEFKEPDILLAYHVEPILAAIAPLYLIHDGPETLLWLQTVVIALGAVPVYLIAYRRIERRQMSNARPLEGEGVDGLSQPPSSTHRLACWLPVVFVAMYLLAPSLEAANLSDFHAVALSPTLLLAAFCCFEADRPWAFVAFAVLALLCKEEVGLLVATMGLWAMVIRRKWWLGLGAVLVGGGWFLFCVRVIMPHFSGLAGPVFLVRYGHLGGGLRELARNAFLEPGLFVSWLRRPDVLRYLRDLWLASGGLAALHPVSLALALPAVAVNAFSAYGWMRSGGGHYSASIVPYLIMAAIYGVDWLAWRAGQLARGKQPAQAGVGMGDLAHSRWVAYCTVSLVLAGFGLAVALFNHYERGISPLSRRFALEPRSEHSRRAEPHIKRVNALPPDTPISVGSNLYPHVSHRQYAYLFPTVSDAEVILLDVTGPSSPVGIGHQTQVIRELLDYAQFGVAESDHGLLLLERGLDEYRLSPTFSDVFYAEDAEPQVIVDADFGHVLRLIGYDLVPRPVVRSELVVEITTYWQVLVPPDEEYRLAFYFWDDARQLVRVQLSERTTQWLPTWLWQPGEVYRLALPALPVGDLPYVGVAWLLPGFEPTDSEGRIVPVTSATGSSPVLTDQGTILELVAP